MRNEIIKWILEILRYWGILSTGGVIVALIALIFVYLGDPIPRQLLLIMSALFLFAAMFKAWQVQYRARLAAEEKYQTTMVPKLNGEIDKVLVAPSGARGENCLLTVLMKIRNTGAPSIAENFQIFVRKGEREFVVIALPGARLNMYEGKDENSPCLTFEVTEYMPKKASAQPIPTGGGVYGFLQATVQGLTKQEVITNDTKLHIAFTDINGKTHQTESPIMTRLMPIPNMELLAQQTRSNVKAKRKS